MKAHWKHSPPLLTLLLISSFLVTGCDPGATNEITEAEQDEILSRAHAFAGTVFIEVVPRTDPDGTISQYHVLVGVSENGNDTGNRVFRLQYLRDPSALIKEGGFEGRLFYDYDSPNRENTDETGVPIASAPKALYVDVPGNRFAMALEEETDLARGYATVLRGVGLSHFSGEIGVSRTEKGEITMDMAKLWVRR